MEKIISSTQELDQLAKQIASETLPGDVFALYGDLGSGKTTFTGLFVKALGIPARVQSPTFVIARKYTGGSGNITQVNHVDLYRLGTEDIRDLGLPELFSEKQAIAVIEWPEVIENMLPEKTKRLHFEYFGDEERKIAYDSVN